LEVGGWRLGRERGVYEVGFVGRGAEVVVKVLVLGLALEKSA
jgi:hypothetical protein